MSASILAFVCKGASCLYLSSLLNLASFILKVSQLRLCQTALKLATGPLLQKIFLTSECEQKTLLHRLLRCSGFFPWSNSCLPQALCAYHLLKRRYPDLELHFGVRDRGSSPFQAHAWLSLHGNIILGKRDESYQSLWSITEP